MAVPRGTGSDGNGDRGRQWMKRKFVKTSKTSKTSETSETNNDGKTKAKRKRGKLAGAELQQRVQRIAARPTSKLAYGAVRLFVIVVAYRYFRVNHRGAEHLDVSGPVIFAPVHRSNLDAPLVGGMTRRRFRALSKESLFPNRLVTAFMASIGAFPVKRGAADLEAIRAAQRMLRDGEALLVFPEGSRQSGPLVTGVFDGVSYLASKAGAPIVPIGIAGTEAAMGTGRKLPRRTRVAIVAGEAIHPPQGRMSRPQLARFSNSVRQRLQEAFDEAQAIAGTTRR